VRYKPNHDALVEWVYDAADIDNQKVVWARDMSAAENAELMRYYKHRQVWLLEADQEPPKLSLYAATAQCEPNIARSLVEKPHEFSIAQDKVAKASLHSEDPDHQVRCLNR